MVDDCSALDDAQECALSLGDLLDSMSPGAIVTVAGAGYREGVLAKEADIGWSTGVVRRPDGDLVFGDIRT